MNTLILLSIISAFSLMADRSDGCSSGQSTGIGCLKPQLPNIFQPFRPFQPLLVEVTTTNNLLFAKKQEGGYCLYNKFENHSVKIQTSRNGTINVKKISFQLVPIPDIKETSIGRAVTSKPVAIEDVVDRLTDEKLADTAVGILSGESAIRKTKTCAKRKDRRIPLRPILPAPNYRIPSRIPTLPNHCDRFGMLLKDTDPDSVMLGKIVSAIRKLAVSSDSQFTCAKRARI